MTKLKHPPLAEDVIKALGGAIKTAKYFGITRDAVYKWDRQEPLQDHLYHYMWYHSPSMFRVKPKRVEK